MSSICERLKTAHKEKVQKKKNESNKLGDQCKTFYS